MGILTCQGPSCSKHGTLSSIRTTKDAILVKTDLRVDAELFGEYVAMLVVEAVSR